MSLLECSVMACVYAALGVPLLLFSLNLPEAEDLTKLKNDPSKILDYPTNAVIVSKVLPLQQMVCGMEELIVFEKGLFPCMEQCKSQGDSCNKDSVKQCMSQYAPPKCKSILSQKSDSKHPFGTHDLSHEFNTLRLCSLVISIILLVMSFLKLVQILVLSGKTKRKSKK